MTMHAPLSVLVVEDQALVAMQLSLLIEDAGHTVGGWATDPEEAHGILQQAQIDVALVDIHLADGPTGLKLATYIGGLDIPVLFMTANAKRVPEDFVGAIGVLAKPFTASSVTAVLGYVHDGVRAPPPATSLPVGLTLSPTYLERWKAMDCERPDPSSGDSSETS